ncbi:hypothetical protein QCA50_001395 [Cerrena zonata]|uniref:Uncharacterized protein n=1 Tax=Cerrena zonata TaxID=2478898 RepID=A0AAW0GLW3_9APHY
MFRCTRWYLPLVLLPLPIAPPYFLVLFILSTTLHARPCFYCVVLLTALFLSSCYWPPVSIETSLSTPWAGNITTFADALLSLMPELSPEKLPSDIPIVDHCWCDISSGQLFEPFNITRWELESVRRLRHTLRAEMKEEIARNQSNLLSDDVHLDSNFSTLAPLQNDSSPAENSSLPWRISWGNVWPFSRNSTKPSESIPPSPSPTLESSPPAPDPEMPKMSITNSTKPWSIFRREYSLHPLGFDMVLDFSWSRRGAEAER